MKEKLIVFTRDEKNKSKVMCSYIAVLIAICVITKIINPIVDFDLLIISVVIVILLKEAILALFKKSENQLRKNKISLILFSDFDFTVTIILIPLILLLAVSSFLINVFLGILLSIIIIVFDIIIASKISKYFSEKLKE